MATLTVETIDITGNVNPTFASVAGGGDDFPNDGSRTFIVIDNQNAGSCVVTLNDTGSVAPDGAVSFDADVDVTIPTTEVAYIGPATLSRFGPSVGLTYSLSASVTIGVFKLAGS